jgi:hypothetical protein
MIARVEKRKLFMIHDAESTHEQHQQRRGSETSLIDVNEWLPRKRVKISMGEPVVHECYYEVDANEASSSTATANKQQDHNVVDTNLWLTRMDLAVSRARARRLSKSMDLDPILMPYVLGINGDLVNNNDNNDCDSRSANKLLRSRYFFAQRGLERYSGSKHGLVRKMIIQQVKSAVLLEQSTQILEGRVDEDKISEISRQASLSSQKFARILAQADAEIAVKVYESGLENRFNQI